ncbi:MAG: polysaccharide biosynthesis/export family protein [Candidatus Binatia bacterium]
MDTVLYYAFARKLAGLWIGVLLVSGCATPQNWMAPPEDAQLGLGPYRPAARVRVPRNRITPPDSRASASALDEPNPALSDFVSRTRQNPASTEHTIGLDDLLQITFFSIPPKEEGVVPRMTEVRVDQRGMITLPLVEDILVEGSTTFALEQELRERYRTYIRDPQIGVLVKSAGMFFVDGAVRKPGSYPLDRAYTLTQALIAAGGVDFNLAKYSDITIARRQSGPQVQIIVVDLKEIRNGKVADPPVLAGDVILVSVDSAKYVIHRFFGSLGASAPIPGP